MWCHHGFGKGIHTDAMTSNMPENSVVKNGNWSCCALSLCKSKKCIANVISVIAVERQLKMYSLADHFKIDPLWLPMPYNGDAYWTVIVIFSFIINDIALKPHVSNWQKN